jgi:hypothetical protein
MVPESDGCQAAQGEAVDVCARLGWQLQKELVLVVDSALLSTGW